MLLSPFARGEAGKAGIRVCEVLTSLTELVWMLDEDNTKFNLGIKTEQRKVSEIFLLPFKKIPGDLNIYTKCHKPQNSS